MGYKLSCAETGAQCGFEVTTDKREELMEHVKLHMQQSHPELLKNPPPPEVIEGLIHQV
jgi:predicted small metal-binding protein